MPDDSHEHTTITPVDNFEPTRRRVLYVVLTAVFMLYAYQFFVTRGDEKWNTLFFSQFKAIVGLPAAAAGAFIIVTLFRVSDGPIEMKGLGVEFKGASGPVILWILCFLAIVYAIHVTWV